MVELNDSELKRLIELAKNQTVETPKIKTLEVIEKYLSTHKVTTTSERDYRETFRLLNIWTEYYPTNSAMIDEFIANLKTKIGKPQSYYSRKTHLERLKSVASYVEKAFGIPNPAKNCAKLINKNKEDRIIWDFNTIIKIIQSASIGFERNLVLTVFDSGCRIGELAITPEHPGLTVDRIYPEAEQIKVYGKSGMHLMHLRKQFCYDLIKQANSEGIVFWSKKKPNGYNNDALRMRFVMILDKAGITGKKRGAHTLRHSAGSVIAAYTDSALAVQKFLDHSDIKMSMNYIHEVQEMKHKQLSPFEILMNQTNQNKAENGIQPLLVSENTEISTALTIVDQSPVEQVEAVPDLSEEMFPDLDPNTIYKIRPVLETKHLLMMRKVFVEYVRRAEPTDPLSAQLSHMMKSWFKRSKL
jgi:integrase